MPSISKHLINRNCTFINQMYPPLVFVVHRTAGHVNNQQLYDYWQSSCVSSHFGISYDGYGYDPYDIWQFVNLWDGSGANCCPESGCHPFFRDRGGNANVYTITVEVCTPNTGNKGLMTAKQVESLVYLIQTVCAELGIPTDQYSEYWNDYETSHTWIGNGGIGMHRDISPHNKQWCPGDPYYQGQMDDIIAAVRGGALPSTDRRKDVEAEQMQLELNKDYLLIPPPGNSMLLVGVDYADANLRCYGHIEGTDEWQNKSFNTRPGQDAWHVDIGPEKWAVDKISLRVTEFNKSGGVCNAVIWPV